MPPDSSNSCSSLAVPLVSVLSSSMNAYPSPASWPRTNHPDWLSTIWVWKLIV